MVVVMFGVAGTGFSLARRFNNEGKVSSPSPLHAVCYERPAHFCPPVAGTTQSGRLGANDDDPRRTVDGHETRPGCTSPHPLSPLPSLLRLTLTLPLALALALALLLGGPQTDPIAPKAFATNSVWTTEKIR